MPGASTKPTDRRVPQWLRDAVIYRVYPQPFQDSGGDGIGDLKWLIRRLPCIRDLGATVI